VTRTGFTALAHGFPFPNCFAARTPVLVLPTPFGPIKLGDAGKGVCGGMVYAALDFYLFGKRRPDDAHPNMFAYFGKRLVESWDIPAGVLKYYDGKRRSSPALSRRTAEVEWPKVRALLDTGRPAPLGLVHVHSLDPRLLVKNHQVVAHGYDFADDAVTLHAYDPNTPGEDVTLTVPLADPEAGTPVTHSIDGPSIRGLFATSYARPWELPAWADALPKRS
jgi:hypothetical protein